METATDIDFAAVEKVRDGIVARYNVTDARIAELKTNYSGLKIRDPKDKTGYNEVAAARSELVKFRTSVEATRKELKADSLEYGRKVDAEAKRITSALLSIEEPLSEEKARIDQMVEAEKAKRQQEINDLVSRRIAALTAVNAGNAIHPLELPSMSEADFQAHLSVATSKFNEEQKLKAEQEAELNRLRKSEEEAKAREAEGLAKQRAEMETAQAALDKQRKEQAEKEAALKVEADRLENEKRQAEETKRREAEAKSRAEELEKAKIEAAEKARLEAEAKAKREAEAKAEQERKDKVEADRLAALRSDKEKMLSYIEALRSVPVPKFEAVEMKEALKKFGKAVQDMILGLV